ncbi:hypothetical protein LNP25_06980 [Klebsiella variicola subsp. variicola]|nr:hypothetical protein [Klebsiella variicola subsp. variicola]
MVSTALCAGIKDEYTLNAVMGTWAVTSGSPVACGTMKRPLYVYGRYVNDGQYIVHEASPTSSGNLEWFTAQWGELSLTISIRPSPACQRPVATSFSAVSLRQQRRAGDDLRLLWHAGAPHPRAFAAGGL